MNTERIVANHRHVVALLVTCRTARVAKPYFRRKLVARLALECVSYVVLL